MAEAAGIDDHSNDAHLTPEALQSGETPLNLEEVEVPNGNGDEITIQDVKKSPHHAKDHRNESSRRNSIHTPDNASVHSLPVAHVTDPHTTMQPRPSTARGPESVVPSRSPTSLSRSQSPQEDISVPQPQRRMRHRLGTETRSSSRLSGFFTSLIHRRDPPTNNNPPNTVDEDASPFPNGQASDTQSRASSPIPARSITPPPPLPAPSLEELGLSLSALTSDLSPSHFSTPPSSGAFLAPHYLLLCHAQGLDVLPLASPPAPQPYALVRRVCFKSIVIMEHRGVLVAIAGRRDGVRVYALEEVKRAIEWRIDVEVRRERDRLRRESMKKIVVNGLENGNDSRHSTEKPGKASLSTPPPSEPVIRNALLRKGSRGHFPISSPPRPPPPSTTVAPLIPRSPTPRATRRPKAFQPQVQDPAPADHPPPYSNLSEPGNPPRTQSSDVSIVTRSRGGSVSDVLAAPSVTRHNLDGNRPRGSDTKSDWAESSDDEAIDIVAAGSSGSQALDERTSANVSAAAPAAVHPVSTHNSTASTRRHRPSDLDLSLSRSSISVTPPEPSPVPTLLTIRQALSNSPPTFRNIYTADMIQDPDTPSGVTEDDGDESNGRISLAQALLESRIPDLPPVGTRRPQEPILIASSHPVATAEDDRSSNRTPEEPLIPNPSNTNGRPGRRRRWSVLLGSPMVTSASAPMASSQSLSASTAPVVGDRPTSRGTRSHSLRSNHSRTSTVRPSTSPTESIWMTPSTPAVPALPEATPSAMSSRSALSSRFIPRLLTNAFHGRRSDERPSSPTPNTIDMDNSKRAPATPLMSHVPPPKLEYVKLPGTKGALMVKAVETPKKSFLAILCGENGEKVELFAGTYRTALGLSRTFILPDSPRSLELQLQGDDLVELYLVFSQNVFGLEPATVRVREVRIGRAERRAARRRAREIRAGETPTNDSEAALAEEDLNINIGVSVTVGSPAGDGPDRSHTPPLIPNEHPGAQPEVVPNEAPPASAVTHSEELVGMAHMGPYTTFQQLSFAPKLPLASIADEYIIPPTYATFLEYRAIHEPEEGNMDLALVQFSPPGLPVPVPTAPSRWFYRDPKNVVHGPWKASLMQAWYKDGLLPPDLPVRREEDDGYVLLKDLRLQCVDPTHPFRCPPPPIASTLDSTASLLEGEKPLLAPISLLSQPRHFGPPALFFSSRGGHSTAIVDARGRSVLKGRFVWSSDEMDEESRSTTMGRMGDVKRLETFDMRGRAVLVAMRRGGLEAVDLRDALLRPADESRTALPQFSPLHSNTNRRTPFVWKIGTPVSDSPTSATILSSKGKGNYGSLGAKKTSTGLTKSPSGREFFAGDVEDSHDEVFFLGRKNNEIYFCERNAGFFRILRLRPNSLQ